MGFPLSLAPKFNVPFTALIIAGLVTWRFFFAKKGEMTFERKAAFAMGMKSQDPEKLEYLAKAFDDEGLPEQAIALRKRALLAKLPPEKALTYSMIVKKALSSNNSDAVDSVADQFEKEGAISTATLLREYANGLRIVQNVQPVQVAPTPQHQQSQQQQAPQEPPTQSQDSQQAQQPFPPATD